MSNEFFSLEPHHHDSGAGLGCIAGLVSGGMSCLAYGCVGIILVPIIVLWVLWYYFAPWIVFAVATAPTIYLVQHWARFKDEPGYESLDQTFSFIIGSEPTEAPLSYIVTFILWLGIQVPYYAVLIYLFPALR